MMCRLICPVKHSCRLAVQYRAQSLQLLVQVLRLQACHQDRSTVEVAVLLYAWVSR